MDEPALQAAVNLYVLGELERLNVLVSRLAARGLIRPEDEAYARLTAEVKALEREQAFAERTGERRLLIKLRQQLSQLRADLLTLDAA